MKIEFAPPTTPPGVASVARAYFKFSATPTGLSHAVSISLLGILAIGAITLTILAWAVCTYFATRRMAAQARELEHRLVERTTELTAINEKLRKEVLERQRAQDALRDPEEKFHQLADNIQEIFWMVDAVTKQAIYVNPAFEQITGRTMASLVEAPLSYREIIHSDDREHVLSALDGAAKTGGFDEEFRIVRPDGTFRWVSAKGFPIRDHQNNVYRLAGVVQDVTARKSAEQALHESQAELARVTRTVTMNELAASISHEIKQPLTAIVTAGEVALRWLGRQPPNLEEAREAVTASIRDANHASAVIERIRALLKGSSPQLQPVKLNEVIREGLLLVANDLVKADVVVRTALADDLPAVLGDRVLLQQVMLNLTTNAIDAMRAVTGRPRELIISSAKNREHVLIQMQDSGKGIASEQPDRIFEPFFTTKPEGIGLGLSISRSIIESLGGRLWAISASPLGATFHFTLPGRTLFMTEPDAIVFVVDDDATVRDALGRLLRSVDLQCELFSSTQDFLQKERADTPSCLILDVRLPGNSGLDFQRELTEKRIHIPIVFLTAHGDIAMSVSAMKAGAVDFLTKPFREQDLLDAIHLALGRSRATRRQEAELASLRERLDLLTPREREILPLVVSGLLNKQIAAEIGISVAAVKVHRSQLIRKMGANSLPGLVRMTEKLGIPDQASEIYGSPK